MSRANVIKSQPFSAEGRRLKEFRLERGLSQGDLASKMGLKDRASISIFENGKRLPPTDALVKLKESLEDIDLNWLLTGAKTTSYDETEFLDVEICGVAGAGPAVNQEAVDFDKYLTLHKNIKRRVLPGRLFALRINGISMEPAFSNGDFVVCSENWGGSVRKLDSKKMYCVNLKSEGGPVIKRVEYKKDIGSLILTSLNPLYEPHVDIVKLAGGEEAPIRGVVVGAWKHF